MKRPIIDLKQAEAVLVEHLRRQGLSRGQAERAAAVAVAAMDNIVWGS